MSEKTVEEGTEVPGPVTETSEPETKTPQPELVPPDPEGPPRTPPVVPEPPPPPPPPLQPPPPPPPREVPVITIVADGDPRLMGPLVDSMADRLGAAGSVRSPPAGASSMPGPLDPRSLLPVLDGGDYDVLVLLSFASEAAQPARGEGGWDSTWEGRVLATVYLVPTEAYVTERRSETIAYAAGSADARGRLALLSMTPDLIRTIRDAWAEHRRRIRAPTQP